MRIQELQNIITTDNFHADLEEYLLEEIQNNNPKYADPFSRDEVTLKMILSTILKCTLILATLMYLFNKKEEVN